MIIRSQKWTKLGLYWCVAVAVGSGCAQRDNESANRVGIDPKPEVASLRSASDSFAPARDGRSLWIRTAALEKEFLFHSSVSFQTGAPTGSGLQARVVSFRRVGNALFLMEATQGHVVTRDLPSELVVAEFPILEESSDSIRFDFNAGMDRVYMAGNWWASDFAPNYEDSFFGFDLRNTFVASLSVDAKRVYVKQIGQIRGAMFGIQMVAPTLEVSYYLSPYHPDPSYVPLETSDPTRVRFFEVAPQFEETSGRPVIRTSRWNFSKGPVTFHVSANTPVEFREAVREGVLYWNKALGREVVRAELAPEGVTAPHPDYNVVQWVPWDRAGFAYADGLMDPRSGEILHAQVYMTSVFAVSGRARARMLLRSLEEQVAQSSGHSHEGHAHGEQSDQGDHAARGSVKGLCQLDLAQQMIQGLQTLLATDADDASILRVAQDYVRDVIAHEIGHTLGMRHNFAGSLAMNVSQLKRDELYADYVTTGARPDPRAVTFSSSVMDYLIFPDSVLLGAMYQDLDTTLEYDMQAMRWAYDGRAMPRVGSSIFCTDSQVGSGRNPVYADCERFDSGANLLEWALYSQAQAIAQFPNRNVEGFLMEIEDRREGESIADAIERKAIYPIATLVAPTATAYSQAMRWLKGKPRSVLLEQRRSVVDELARKELEDEVQALALEWANALGGPAALVTAPFVNVLREDVGSLSSHWTRALDAVLASTRVASFRGLDGREHELNAEHRARIRERLVSTFEYAEQSLYEALLKVHSGRAFSNEGVAEQIEGSLEPIARHFVLAVSDERIEGILPPKTTAERKNEVTPPLAPTESGSVAQENGGESAPPVVAEAAPGPEPVSVPTFRYSPETRTAAAQLLSAQLGPFVDWSEASRKSLREAFDGVVRIALGRDLTDRSIVLENVQNRRLKGWISEQKRLRGMLN